ncbi:hypothetical protein [Halalkalibacillus halophilus]|uniref:hypothetical protein n=1 Tax=Halalkalibacillus halophilus TaxID=392827 RepID=UPI0003F8069F|nr:hypothetical protein [Halalkalibacillus halophilus]
MRDTNENQVIEETLEMMKPKIKKSLKNTRTQERNDLEQEIKLKVVDAVKSKKIVPINFLEFIEEVNK